MMIPYQVTIDHRGNWFRWKLTIGSGRGSTFGEGKSGSYHHAREIAYEVLSLFCRGIEFNEIGNVHFPLNWPQVEWIETPEAIKFANRYHKLERV
jgi:hypothetical protein